VTGALKARLSLYIPFVLVAGVISLVLYQTLDPTPPRRVRIASGAPDGMYAEAAQRYRAILARDHVELEIVPTSGSIESLALLRRPDGVDLAFVQGGTAAAADELQSLASVFREPLWVFVRAELTVERLTELQRRRLAIGVEGSGTRALALELLQSSGVGDPGRLRSIGDREAVNALLDGSVDAAFFVTARPLPLLEPLLRSPKVRLMSLAQADAYTRRYRYLSKLMLPEGVLDLAADVPPYDVVLLAPAASLVARTTLHPAIVDLVMQAATEVHGPAQIFAEAGEFPSARQVEVPLGIDAQRYFKSGPTFLRRHLPFWAATQAERAIILLLPTVGLLVPLAGFIAPYAFQARVRRRFDRAYGRLLALERRAVGATTDDEAPGCSTSSATWSRTCAG
jgi:TRAP-type uncharacterized transport system substrate-binding protein